MLAYVIYSELTRRSFEEGYQSVRKWTQKFDLFEKKYLVVPINEKYVSKFTHCLMKMTI